MAPIAPSSFTAHAAGRGRWAELMALVLALLATAPAWLSGAVGSGSVDYAALPNGTAGGGTGQSSFAYFNVAGSLGTPVIANQGVGVYTNSVGFVAQLTGAPVPNNPPTLDPIAGLTILED